MCYLWGSVSRSSSWRRRSIFLVEGAPDVVDGPPCPCVISTRQGVGQLRQALCHVRIEVSHTPTHTPQTSMRCVRHSPPPNDHMPPPPPPPPTTTTTTHPPPSSSSRPAPPGLPSCSACCWAREWELGGGGYRRCSFGCGLGGGLQPLLHRPSSVSRRSSSERPPYHRKQSGLQQPPTPHRIRVSGCWCPSLLPSPDKTA